MFCYLGYTDGPSVKRSGFSVCSDESGTLEWAAEQCNKDDNCNWLHDAFCDNEKWRFCPNVRIEDLPDSKTDSCSKLKGNQICNVKL